MLIGKDVTDSYIAGINRGYNIGPFLYAEAFLIAFFSGLASVVAVVLLAVFYAIVALTPTDR